MEKKIKKYKIIENIDPKFFEEEINKHIEEGWEPHGSMTTTTFGDVESGYDVTFYQPMVLYV